MGYYVSIGLYQVGYYEDGLTCLLLLFLLSGKLSQLVHHHEGQGYKIHSQGRGHRHISEHELKDKSDRHLNIQVCISEFRIFQETDMVGYMFPNQKIMCT